MTDRCISPEELGLLAQGGAGDHLQTHLAACPRCRALLASYRMFLEVDVPPEVDLAGVEDRLATFVQSEILPGAKRTFPVRRYGFPRLAWRPLFGLAGASAVILLIILWPRALDRFGRPSGGQITRGLSPAVEDGIKAGIPQREADDAIRFRWSAVRGSDRYRLIFLDPSFRELARCDAGSDTTLLLTRAQRTGLGLDDALIFWQVLATRGDEEVSHTVIQSFRLPVPRTR